MAISKDDLNKAVSRANPTASNVVSSDLKGAIQRPNTNPLAENIRTRLPGSSQIKSSGEDSATPSAQLTLTNQQAENLQESPNNLVRPNSLNKFASYNYIIELQATSILKQKDFQTSENYVAADWKTLISSAGGTGGVTSLDDNDKRKWFTKEYYLDDLEFTSVVGVTNNARATADLVVNFNVSEPYGINFIQELWEYNTVALQCANWSETAYLIKITFKGYDDQGQLQQSDTVKYLPIKIINIEVKLTESGSIYTVSGYVYNNQGNDKIYGVLNKQTQCEGKTVSDIILGNNGVTNPVSESLTLVDNPSNLKKSLNQDARFEAQNNGAPSTETAVTQYDFEFIGKLGKKIARAQISDLLETKDSTMDLPKNDYELRMLRNLKSYQFLGQRNDSGTRIKIQDQKVNFNAGLITEVLSQLIINSNYVTDQIRDFRKKYQDAVKDTNPQTRKTKFESLKAPFEWFRIVPKVYDTGTYDEYANRYQKRIIYQILGYTISNAPGVGGVLVPSEKQTSIAEQVVKEYNYFFTGKNSEIIRLDINLNTNYWNYRPRNPKIADQATGTKPGTKSGDNPDAVYALSPKYFDSVTATDPLNSTISQIAARPERSVLGTGSASPDRVIAGQIASSIYNNVTQLVVEMEILGDPDLFKQDGVYKTQADDQIPIIFDNQEQYVRLTFANPRDIDDSTGTLDKKYSKVQESVFSGLYVIIKIDNFFKQGKFTQQLTLRRAASGVDDQPEPIINIKDDTGLGGKIIDTPIQPPSVINA